MMFLPCFSRALALAKTSKADSVPMRDILSASFMPPASSLNEGGGPARPRFAAFLLGYGFHVLNVSAGLGQNMVEVVAKTDEGKSLIEELPDARRAEQEEA